MMHTKNSGPFLVIKGVKFVALVVAGYVAFAAPALAQGGAIFDELQRIRRDLNGLQQYVYRGDGGDNSVVSGGAAAGSGSAQGNFNARIQRQMQVLQDRMRDLTGLVEEVQHGISTVGARLDKLVGDVDYRLQLLEQNSGQAPGASRRTSGLGGAQSSFVGAAPEDNGATTVISSSGVQRVKPTGSAPSGTLGTISQNAVTAIQRGEVVDPQRNTGTVAPGLERRAVARNLSVQPGSTPKSFGAPAPGNVAVGRASIAAKASVLPAGTPKDQYDFAYSLLRKRNYPGAESAFRAFIEKYPDNALSGNAMYWMGETFYVRKNYTEAARIFLDGYQRFPKGGKAAGNLLKLAKSLSEIGEIKSACASYKELLSTFPDAGARTLSAARHESSRLKCG